MPAWFRLSPAAFALILLLGVMHLFLSDRVLWHTDLWGHLAYGRLIAANRALPQTESLMPLSQGMPFIDTAWLSQVLGYAAFRWRGVSAIQFLYAASITLCLALLAYRTRQRTGSIAACVLGMAACAWVEWQQFLIVRPQLAGLVCFASLFVYLTRREFGRERWFVVPALFAAWSNLHGSFAAGLATLIAFACGRAADVVRRTGRPAAAWSDKRFRQFGCMMFVAVAAVLVNPYGLRIFRAIWETSSNANLSDLVEWRPLDIQMRQGQAAAIVALALVILYRVSPRRVSIVELFLLAGLGLATLFASRMIVWWGPVAAYYLAIHASAAWRRFRRTGKSARGNAGSRARPGWALAAVGFIAIVFARTPLGTSLLHGTQTDPHNTLSAQTPVDATAWLNAHPPAGQIFNTYEWGDYLLWAGPPGLQVFVASHAHLVPTDVWRDYMHVINVADGWATILDRYGVNTIIVDTEQHAALTQDLRNDGAWSIDFEDARSVVFARHPIR